MQRRIEVLRRMERQYLRKRLAAIGLQSPEGLVLYLLAAEGRLRQEDVVHRFGIDKGTVARSVARLEERGLVRRRVSDQCRREKLVELTEEGRALAARIREILNDWEEIGYRGFTPEERALYESLQLRIVENALEYRRGEEHDG